MAFSARQAIAEQTAANRSGIAHFEAFQSHRDHTTSAALRGLVPNQSQRLCVLGAGNCYDLDFERLTQYFTEIHLVDLDEAALRGACERQPSHIRAKLRVFAPVDLTGFLGCIERWREGKIQVEELLSHPERVPRQIMGALAGPYDRVVSSSVFTQLHLSALNVLTDRHRLYPAVRQTMSLTHLRTLYALTLPGSRAVLVTDVSSSEFAPLDTVSDDTDLLQLLDELVQGGRIIGVAHPGLLGGIVKDDPILKRETQFSGPLATWLWQQGPERRMLVYAAELSRRPSSTERG